MRLHLHRLVGLFCLVATLPLFAADTPKKTAIDYDKIAGFPPGVYKIEFDQAGRIQSCLIVGRSRISTVLGLTKGKEVAQKRAALAADAEFVKWLKSKVSVHEKTADETILFLEGREENDMDALKESGKAVEKTSTRFSLKANGMVRGMTIAHYEVSSEEKTYTLIKRWRGATAAKAVKEIEESEKGKSGTTGKKTDKTIKDKKGTIED